MFGQTITNQIHFITVINSVTNSKSKTNERKYL